MGIQVARAGAVLGCCGQGYGIAHRCYRHPWATRAASDAADTATASGAAGAGAGVRGTGPWGFSHPLAAGHPCGQGTQHVGPGSAARGTTGSASSRRAAAGNEHGASAGRSGVTSLGVIVGAW